MQNVLRIIDSSTVLYLWQLEHMKPGTKQKVAPWPLPLTARQPPQKFVLPLPMILDTLGLEILVPGGKCFHRENSKDSPKSKVTGACNTKHEIMPSAVTWMDLESHTKWSKPDKEGEISYGIPYMCNLKRNYTNEFTKQKQTHRLREGAYGCVGLRGGKWGEEIIKEFGIDMHTLLYLK